MARATKPLTFTRVLIRFLIYVGIAVVFLAVMAGWVVLSARLGVGMLPVRWIGLAINTPIVFWYPAHEHKQHWHRPSFWVTLTGLFILHVLAFTVLLRNYPEWRLLWFVPTDLIEMWGVYLMLYATVDHGRKHEQHS